MAGNKRSRNSSAVGKYKLFPSFGEIYIYIYMLKIGYYHFPTFSHAIVPNYATPEILASYS